MLVEVPCPVLQVEGRNAVWLSSEYCVRQEVAGESFNAQHISSIVERATGRVGLQTVAWLVPEPTNPADTNAVIVWMGGGKVGYLPRTDAVHWKQIIVGLMRDKHLPVACLAHIEPPRSGVGGLQAVLWLPPVFPAQTAQALSPAAVASAIAQVEFEQRTAEQRKQQAAADLTRWQIERLAGLTARFGQEAASQIIAKKLWLGATTEMVVETFGQPTKDDVKALKNKVKRTLSFAEPCMRCNGTGFIPEFAHVEGGRCRQCAGAGKSKGYYLRVHLENDVVVGWEDRRG